jgi:hypothetical protein
MNGILGIFGLAATKVETLVALKGSQQVLQKMRQRHIKKRIKYKGILKGRVAKKLFALVPIGGVSFVVYDYCQDEGELQKDEDILNGTQTKFGMKECMQRGKENITHELYELKEKLKKLKNRSVDGTKKGLSEAKKWIDNKGVAFKKKIQLIWQKIKNPFRRSDEKNDSPPLEETDGGRSSSKEETVTGRWSLITEKIQTIKQKITDRFSRSEEKRDDTSPKDVLLQL